MNKHISKTIKKSLYFKRLKLPYFTLIISNIINIQNNKSKKINLSLSKEQPKKKESPIEYFLIKKNLKSKATISKYFFFNVILIKFKIKNINIKI